MGVAKESIPTRLASNFTIQGLSGDCRILEPYAGPRQVQSMFSYLTTDESTTSEYTNGEVDFEAQLYYGYTCTTFWYLYPHLIPLLYVLVRESRSQLNFDFDGSSFISATDKCPSKRPFYARGVTSSSRT